MEMICPKAKECLQLYPNNECRHVHKHQYSINCKDADIINKCPFPDTTCIEYKPEPDNKLLSPFNLGIKPDSGQLYILPPKETIEVILHTHLDLAYNNGIDAVYASAKHVDKTELSIFISRRLIETDNVAVTHIPIKQAIEAYIKE